MSIDNNFLQEKIIKNNLSNNEISNNVINERNKEISKITNELNELSDIQDIILKMTLEQEEQLDNIDNNLEITNNNLNNGINLLEEASKYKNTVTSTICGSAIGCVLGGPLGLIVGANPAILSVSTLFLGGIIGYGYNKI